MSVLAAAALLAVAAAAPELPPPAASTFTPDTPLSERVVAYQIEARLDTEKKTLEATEVLTYRNRTGRPLDLFPFHLYLNAFQPQSTFMREVRQGSPDFEWKEKYRRSEERRVGKEGRSRWSPYH